MIDDGTASREPVIRVLGPVELVGRTGTATRMGGKPAAVLVALALTPGEWVSTGQLVDLVWRGTPPASAAKNLKTFVWQLRRALAATSAEGGIESRPGGYRLGADAGELDATAFGAEAARAGSRLRCGDAAGVAARVVEVLSWWRGRPYDEIADYCADPVFARLREQRLVLREVLAAAYVTLGRAAEAVELLTAVTAEDPLREASWARLVEALRVDGRRGDALAAYQRARSALLRELGVEPGPELAATQRSVLESGCATPDWPVPHQLPRSVRTAGVDAELRTLTGAGPGLVTVTGTAGAGKTVLAVAAGHALAPEYPDGQVYVEVGTHAEPLGTGAVLARLVRAVAGPGVPLPASVPELAALWRSVSYGRRLLVVLDDVSDGEQLELLLPGTAGCLVVATSRTPLTAADVTVRLGEPHRSLVQPAVLRPAARRRDHVTANGACVA